MKSGTQEPKSGTQAVFTERERWTFADMDRRHRGADGRLTMTVEAALRWAWKEELPKAPRAPAGPDAIFSSWGKASEFADYLTLVDKFGVNRFGCVPDFSATNMPSPDALALADAVGELDLLDLDLPIDWNPAPELDRFGGLAAKALSDALRRIMATERDGSRRLKLKPSVLIIRRAVLGDNAEACRMDDVTEEVERHADGRTRWFRQMAMDVVIGTNRDGSERTELRHVEVPGMSSRGHPYPDAYRKPFLDPDPIAAIVARAEHEIWQSALWNIHESLAASMVDIRLLPPSVPARPWESVEGRRAIRVHESPESRTAWFLPAQRYG